VWESTHLIVFYLVGVGDRDMRTSSLVQFGIGALIVILIFLSRRRRKPRFKLRPAPTEAEITAKRQKNWEAYLIERGGGHQTPPAEKQPKEFPPPDE
jgi:hypothetical protein